MEQHTSEVLLHAISSAVMFWVLILQFLHGDRDKRIESKLDKLLEEVGSEDDNWD